MKKYSVLVVDDSSSILNALKNFLSDDLDIDVYTAKTMKETAKVLLEKKGKFEVVLAD
jgi:DNA-binding NtrC family response regulator